MLGFEGGTGSTEGYDFNIEGLSKFRRDINQLLVESNMLEKRSILKIYFQWRLW